MIWAVRLVHNAVGGYLLATRVGRSTVASPQAGATLADVRDWGFGHRGATARGDAGDQVIVHSVRPGLERQLFTHICVSFSEPNTGSPSVFFQFRRILGSLPQVSFGSCNFAIAYGILAQLVWSKRSSISALRYSPPRPISKFGPWPVRPWAPESPQSRESTSKDQRMKSHQGASVRASLQKYGNGGGVSTPPRIRCSNSCLDIRASTFEPRPYPFLARQWSTSIMQ
mmetsp:Transcript_61902/g.122393  ORF Transcript_61902/g.122393 Transcript_61902/m.122393 type:complete len:227 (+) Transcript_61902:1899-2579(+)